MSPSLQLALRYVFSRKRTMMMSLLGIVFGIAFFIVTQAQTSGFQKVFIDTILGTSGAIRISDRFQDNEATISKVSSDGKTHFIFKNRENSRFIEGIDHPAEIIESLSNFPSVIGISEILETIGRLNSHSRGQSVQVHGLRIQNHIEVSNIENQLIQGSIEDFEKDRMGILVGYRIAQRLNIKLGERVNLVGSKENFQLRVSGIFETGASEIDKKRIYIDLSTARSLIGKRFGGSILQLALSNVNNAPDVAKQIQESIGHRTVSWQEREKVWLDVFKALRISSAITVSCILLLSGLGMFNVFAIMVIEKTRDIAILRSIGFSPRDVSSVFLWQGTIVLIAGIILGVIAGAIATYIISQIPLSVRGIFSTDKFAVNWDISHYLSAVLLATLFVSIASWIPARRASKIEPAKIIRESI